MVSKVVQVGKEVKDIHVGCRAARRSAPKQGEKAIVFGTESILDIYQDMGKIESRIVVVAVRAGKRPVDEALNVVIRY